MEAWTFVCLLNRAYTICTDWTLFNNIEVENISDSFKSNGYPMAFFEKCFNSFLTNKLSSDPKLKETDDSRTRTVIIPYLGLPSLQFKRQLVNAYKTLDINVKVVFRTFRIGSYFSFKKSHAQ